MTQSKAWKFLQKHCYGLLAPLLALSLYALVYSQPFVTRLENITVDWRFDTRLPLANATDPSLLLIAIDQPSLDRFGGWPWPRNYHGDLLYLLDSEQPSVIAFDILFSDRREERRDRFLAGSLREEQANQYFAESLRKNGKVILSAFAQSGQSSQNRPGTIDYGKTRPLGQVHGNPLLVPGIDDPNHALTPMALLRYESFFGFTDTASVEADSIRRQMPLVIRVGSDLYPSFITQILLRHFQIEPEKVEITLGQSLRLPTPKGAINIPINERGELLLNYRPEMTFPSSSFTGTVQTLYDKQQQGKQPPATFTPLQNKIILVGATVSGLMELASTPISSSSPPVYTHLIALNNILKNDFLRPLPVPLTAIGFLLVSWITLIGLRKKSIRHTLSLPLLTLALYFGLCLYLFNYQNILAPLFWPALGFMLLHLGSFFLSWIDELRSKQQIKSVFASYIAPSVMNQLLNSEENIKLGGVRKPVTILFSDIRGFTSISEALGEEDLVVQLNEYFEQMVECVNRYQGTLHKYIGDAVMAVWGDVVSNSPRDDARNAVRSALAMREQLAILNQRWLSEGRAPFKIGIGLNHGNVLVGNIGASQRREFTVIGDAVNLASRLEGTTKEFHTDFVIGESVQQFLKGEFLVRSVGVLMVKGKTLPVRAYEVLEAFDSPNRLWQDSWVSRYEQAFDAFLARDFDQAARLWAQCLDQCPDDFSTKQYLTQAQGFQKNPPPPDWDGVITMTSK
jgi:adenylate cyclase